MANNKPSLIPNRLKNAAIDGYVAGAVDIIDDAKNKHQQKINAETDSSLANHQQQLNNKYNKDVVYRKDETYSKEQLNSLITTPEQQYVTITADDQTVDVTDVLPATGEADTVYRVGNWDGTQYDPTVYTEYAWDSTQYIPLDTKQYTLATAEDFIEPDANKRAKVPTVGAVSEIHGYYIENPQFIRVELDEEDRIIRAIKKDGTEYLSRGLSVGDSSEIISINDSSFLHAWVDDSDCILMGIQKDGFIFFGRGVPKQIIDYVYSKLEVDEKLDKKVDGEYIDNDEYIKIELDNENKIIEGIKSTGTKVLNVPVEIKGVTIDGESSSKFMNVELDNEGRILSGRKIDGTKVEYCDVEYPNGIPNDIKEYIDDNGGSGKWWNRDSSLHNAINQIRRRINDTTPQADAAAYRKHPPVLSFLWFSDVHDDVPRLERIMEFAKEYPSYYDDIICTGDANDLFTNDFSYWHRLGCDKVLLSLGNHEQVYITYDGDRRIVHRDVPQVDLYNKYYAPYVAQQNVVYQEGKVYWYKDYVRQYKTAEGADTSKTIRLIQVYPTLDNASQEDNYEQLIWFNNVLDDARQNGYYVVVMTHYKATPCILIPSNFTQVDGTTDGHSMISFLTAVNTFKNNGGEFICWLTAHSHQDRLSYKEGYENQLFININCAMLESTYADAERIVGTRSEDCFNIIGLDIDQKLIKMVRVGSNVDYLLRNRNGIVINYSTKEIITQF